ncbi:MAG: RNA 2',3'-cyclic phosphodiesterase [Acidobacteria bacterium]|nr:RNA 2',3'-cyclic phosphodiesterase [Acidobacteriota bacterium]
MRAFIAIDLPHEIRIELARWQTAFRSVCPDARWTRPEGIHLTLKFLGEITDAQVGRVTETLAGLGALQRFSVEIKSFGFFPDVRRPRGFWAGVAAPPELVHLARRVEDAMGKVGFPSEKRAFSPHLTLARFREPRPQPALREAAEKQAGLLLGRFEVTQFFLYESKLAPQGAEYRKIAHFPAE